MRIGLLFSIFIFALILQTPAHAHPVPYQGAVGVMTWNQPFLSDHWITYSLHHRVAIAARAMRMEMPDGQALAYFPQVNLLLQRWNGENTQANIYAYGGYGGASFQDNTGWSGSYGVEADAESRSWFVLGKIETMWSNRVSPFRFYQGRVGLAPYEAEFNELASWFMVQFQYQPSMGEKYVITPLARMFYRNILWEVGVSIRGDWMLNLMFHF